MLLRSQKKAVFEMLRTAGFEPSDFDWSLEDCDGARVERLSYREDPYYFQFSSYESGACCMSSPGAYQLVEYEYPRAWAQQADSFRNWTERLRREVTCGDPWETLAKYRLAVADGGGLDGPNETISGAEVEQIGRRLAALGDELELAFELEGESSALARERLAYLAEAAKRLKSRDWCYAAVGVCATLAMLLSLDEDQARRLWSMVKNRVGTFVRLSERQGGSSEAA